MRTRRPTPIGPDTPHDGLLAASVAAKRFARAIKGTGRHEGDSPFARRTRPSWRQRLSRRENGDSPLSAQTIAIIPAKVVCPSGADYRKSLLKVQAFVLGKLQLPPERATFRRAHTGIERLASGIAGPSSAGCSRSRQASPRGLVRGSFCGRLTGVGRILAVHRSGQVAKPTRLGDASDRVRQHGGCSSVG
jgi:hypothetical protein